ncbi:ATP-binding protein [Streptomyces sp. DK15]|uniref:ATP-binding protein n=1 Tax=Streptomyces sp. DK15 TaxID=2957499 RepID=UPI0029B7E6EC|nr:ATP-binding protein [Streptomyces sp. DK15]MDX2389206.1 ATP-binding protein [Streptomyces sp. DK15]
MERSRGSDEPGGQPPLTGTTPAKPGGSLPATAADARDQVAALLRQSQLPHDADAVADALMVTTELVTNAIRHGGGLAGFHADVHDGALRVSVADHSSEAPVAQTSPPAGIRIGGYGWPLVQSLVDDLTVTPHPNGKQITAHLKLR